MAVTTNSLEKFFAILVHGLARLSIRMDSGILRGMIFLICFAINAGSRPFVLHCLGAAAFATI